MDMGLEGIMLSEVKTEKDKYHVISFICGIWKTNEQKTHKEQTHNCYRGEGWGDGWKK